MSTAVEPIQTQESITFYSWIENKGSSQVVQISGGQKSTDGAGRVYNVPLKTVQFNHGILHTDDPEAIAVLRKQAKKGHGITEDHEEYLRHVLPPEQQVARLRAVAEETLKRENELSAENSRLRKQLEELGRRQAEAKGKG